MTIEQKNEETEKVNSQVARNPPSLLDAARALFESPENEVVTRLEWDSLGRAVAAIIDR